MPKVYVKRGTLAKLNAAASSNLLNAGEVYLITDQNRLAVGLGTNSYETFAKSSETSTSHQIAKTTATQADTTASLVNLTQLVLSVAANSVYEIDCFVTFQSAATSTGLKLGLALPTSAIANVEIVVPITSTAASSQLRTIFPNAAVASNAPTITGTGVTAITSNHTARISGLLQIGATAGSCQVKFATEISTSAVTIQIGSILKLTKLS